MRIVMKFGGTSVGSADAIRRVVSIVGNLSQLHEVVVVVSAMNAPDLRTTDSLVSLGQAAARGDSSNADGIIDRLIQMHMQTARELATFDECTALEPQMHAILDYISNLSRCIAVLGELTPRALDLISGQGERCNARLIASALRSAKLDAEAVDATDIIVTNDQFNEASPFMDETRLKSQQRLLPLFQRGCVPVVTGFIGATREGVTTTLGRGGSDYTCSILGAVLDADEVWFWKEVDGVMSSDPRMVPDAQSIPKLSYIEMSEMAYYGANVLHPKTVYPLVQRSIPIRILNTFNPSHLGTYISADQAPMTIKAITAIKDASLIRVGGPGMLGFRGMAARIFAAAARAGANLLMITQGSSEQNICIAVPRSDSQRAVDELRTELAPEISYHDVEHVDVQESVMIVAVVGSGMRGTPGIAGRACSALGDAGISIIAIAQGSTEYNISMVVDAKDGEESVRVIHRAFALGKEAKEVRMML